MRISIKLPGGTLKLKSYRMLRSRERDGYIPKMSVGALHLIWWSNANLARQEREH